MTQALNCHFLIGLPASGKSTLAEFLAKTIAGVVVSTDSIRDLLYCDPSIQGDWAEIEVEVFRQIQITIARRQSVIYDATNASHTWRTQFLERVADFEDVRWIGWYLKTPIDLCKQRNQMRDRQVPDPVIDRMADDLNQISPEIDEGMAKIYSVPFLSNGEIDLEGVVKLLDRLNDFGIGDGRWQ
jgi:predicted kinase